MPADRQRRRPRRLSGRARLACIAGLVALLAACHHAPPPPSNATPNKAVATALRLTADGDFDALMQNRLPPPDYAAWRQEWDAARARPPPVSSARAQQFREIMRMLTAPDAEKQLLKRLQPQLAQWKRAKAAKAPIFSGILEAAGTEMIGASPQLGPAQKAMAKQGLGALVAWAATADFSDAKKAKHAVALVCATARELHVQTLDQWRTLDYATTMKDYGILWNALEQLADLYGLDLARTFTDAKITSAPTTTDVTTVKVHMTLAGKPISGSWPMRKIGEHWYDESLLDAWRKAHPTAAASAALPASTATAQGGSPAAASAPTAAPPPAAGTPGSR